MVITRDLAYDILHHIFAGIPESVLYDACEEYNCVVGDIFPTFDELLVAVEEEEVTID